MDRKAKTLTRDQGKRRDSDKDLKKLVRGQVRSMQDSVKEIKYIVPAVISLSLNSFNAVDLTSLITQGTTAQTRIGANVYLKKLEMTWQALLGDPTNLVRVLIYEWLVDSSTDVPQITELLEDSSTIPRQILSPLLVIKPHRFRMLHDGLVDLDTYHPQRHGKLTIKLGNMKVGYNLGVNTGRNHLYITLLSDSGVIPAPTFSYEMKILYTD